MCAAYDNVGSGLPMYLLATEIIGYGGHDFAFAPYGAYWRALQVVHAGAPQRAQGSIWCFIVSMGFLDLGLWGFFIERRSSLGLRFTVLLMHVMFVGAVFILDPTLDWRIHEEPWYIGLYGVLVLLTLVQYFYTAGSSPGYVIDVMRAGSMMHATFVNTAALSKQSNSRNGNTNSPTSHAQLQKLSAMTPTSWAQMVVDLYPPGSNSSNLFNTHHCLLGIGLALTAGLFRTVPPKSNGVLISTIMSLKNPHILLLLIIRVKVLLPTSFCSHLVLGTAMTVINASFNLIITAYGLEHALAKRTIVVFGEFLMWYISEETILCIWTAVLYIESLRLDVDKAWWKDFVGVILLAVLIFILIFLLLLWLFHSYIAVTNQTTYEVARRKRIFYLRGVPERVHPFSRGICRNLYDFCCSSQKGYILEAVPPREELEARAARYTCRDVICCRCC
ncbi:Protein S-acyltransferase 10 [Zea mays]|uniref:Protein S-acyltransferase 10 n=1 Tax=Zea mays TaxID=4577 RepID=A0A1D6Q6T4_MAIZE|nr:Protein S-acyltransferase 10 [Zea mays]